MLKTIGITVSIVLITIVLLKKVKIKGKTLFDSI